MGAMISEIENNQNLSSLAEFIRQQDIAVVKLHLGCGGMRWRDFINVDMYPYDDSVADSSRQGCIADVYADMRILGLPDNSVDEIFTSHTIDHFNRWVAVDMLKDWYRMLKPGGKVVIEVADFVRCILWLLHPNRTKRQAARNQFYGNQWDRLEYETHRYVWSRTELVTVIRNIGFKHVTYSHKTWTHYPGRDMHVEAIKESS